RCLWRHQEHLPRRRRDELREGAVAFADRQFAHIAQCKISALAKFAASATRVDHADGAIADIEAAHIGTDLDNFGAEFVAEHRRHRRHQRPGDELMQIAAAYSAEQYAKFE